MRVCVCAPCTLLPMPPYLDQIHVLPAELTLRQVLPVHHPGVLENLQGRETLLWVHMQHLGHDILGRRDESRGGPTSLLPCHPQVALHPPQ